MPSDHILLWPDGFWCFRKELAETDNLMRGSQYRIVLQGSEEWAKLTMPLVPLTLRNQHL